jgi:hypothetical protein
MELVNVIKEEIKLRDNGKLGKLENLSYIHLLCLAHKLRISIKG